MSVGAALCGMEPRWKRPETGREKVCVWGGGGAMCVHVCTCGHVYAYLHVYVSVCVCLKQWFLLLGVIDLFKP